MQKIGYCLIAFLLLNGCKSSTEPKPYTPEKKEPVPVFPITDYLNGQIAEIEKLPVTPLVLKINGNETDSIWIKREQLKELAQPFLHPVIDSATLNAYFKGKSFLDQTVNAITFTYEANKHLPREIDLTEMNVYVEPEKNEVDRIYLVKNIGDTALQLTWKAGKWFSIRSIVQKDDGSSMVSETKVKWDFNEPERENE